MNCYICGTGISVCDKCKDYYIPDYSNSLAQIVIELAVPKIIPPEKETIADNKVIEFKCPNCKNCITGIGITENNKFYTTCSHCKISNYNCELFIIGKIYKICLENRQKHFYYKLNKDFPRQYWQLVREEEVSNHD